MSKINIRGCARRAMLCAVALFLVALCAWLVPVGVSAADYSPKVKELIGRAEGGDVAAQVELGAMFRAGKGVPKDRSEAIRWYTAAAHQGHTEAQYQLALMYDAISTEKRGKEEGRSASDRCDEWLDRAAKQGHAKAAQKLQERFRQTKAAAQRGDVGQQATLGYMYGNGYGVPSDYEEAVKWHRKAAERGNPTAQANLGRQYESGRGVTKNLEEAVKWYGKSAERGNADGQARLGLMYDMGLGVAQNYEEAVKWYRKSAEQGNYWAQRKLGSKYYSRGRIDAQNYEEAVKWYRKSAEQGDPWAQNSLGWMYHNGFGVPQNYEEAEKWYRKAAEQDHGTAKENLEILAAARSKTSTRTPMPPLVIQKPDETAAAKPAAPPVATDADAQLQLGLKYARGEGVPKDDKRAVQSLRRAAELGHPTAQYLVGCLYRDGQGVPQDRKEAQKWLKAAADQGNEDAKQALAALPESSKEDINRALLSAAKGGAVAEVQRCLSAGADVNAKSPDGYSPVQLAADGGHKDIVRLLLDESLGVDVNALNGDGFAALHYAAYRGHLDIIKLLLDKGAQVNLKGDKSSAPLQAAISGGQLKALELLLARGADVNLMGQPFTPLAYAVDRGNQQMVEALVKAGADIAAKLPTGETALSLAESEGKNEIAQFLKSKTAAGK